MESGVARRFVTVALTLAAVLGIGSVAFFAARAPGYASASVRADQPAAWVTSSKDLMIGLLNRQTNEVQSPAYLESPDTDVLQNGDTVVVVDRRQHNLRSLDTTDVVLSGKLTLPQSSDVAMSASTLAVADRRSGKIWVLPTAGLGSGDLTTEAPSGSGAPGAVVTVSGGVVTAAAPGGSTLTTLTAGGDGPPQVATSTVPGGPLSAAGPGHPDPVSITSVGDVPVVLDASAGRLVVRGRSFRLPDGVQNPVLQQAGPAAAEVLVSTATGLLTIDLASGRVRSRSAAVSGRPAAPVRVGDCVHAAWAGRRPTYLAWCGSTPSSTRPIDKVAATGTLIFRVNEQTVVLNDTATGNAWVLDDGITLVNNWDEIRSRDSEFATSDSGGQGKAERLSTARNDCSNGMAPPAPRPDAYGVRPGRPRVLRVLDNDDSSSCSVSLVSKVQVPAAAAAAGTTAFVVDEGTGVQVTLPSGATAPVSLTYTVTDGAGHEAAQRVVVTPVTDPKPLLPKKIRDSATAVTVGGTVTRNVLSDWISPSGDDLFLVGARSSVPDDKISYSADGAITIGDTGTTGATKKAISFSVSDGLNTVPGTLTVEVVDEDKARPVASPVHAAGIVDEQIRIAPLESVLWPGSENLTLTKVAAKNGVAGLTVTPDQQGGTVTVTGAKAGSYYLDYQVAAGDKEAKGVIRVDIRAAPDAGGPPVAMTDVAYLPSGGQTLVDLTRNDTDPAGGIVAVQQLSAPEDSGLVIQGADMHLAKISARRTLPPGGSWVPYSVSAGGATGQGWLHVVEVPPPSEPMSPTAAPIAVTVRAGDAVSIPIAGHATDPAGEPVTPLAFPGDAIGADQGLLFVTGDAIRYMAPITGNLAGGKTLRTQYTVTNVAGRKASANLSITVIPRGDNSAPRPPQTAQGRVFAGGTVDIPLPVDGIDPDGDWAIASTIDGPPSAGSAAVSGTSTVRYTAFGKPGADSFTYTVTDAYGGSATGTVDVLIGAAAADRRAADRPGPAGNAGAGQVHRGGRARPGQRPGRWPGDVPGQGLAVAQWHSRHLCQGQGQRGTGQGGTGAGDSAGAVHRAEQSVAVGFRHADGQGRQERAEGTAHCARRAGRRHHAERREDRGRGGSLALGG